MLKAFCDVCAKECSGKTTQTRRFERLGVSKETSKSIGFELVLLFDGAPSMEGHVCGNCIFDLLWSMAKKNSNTSLALRLKNLERNEGRSKIIEDSLQLENEELARREALLKERENKLAESPEQLYEKIIVPLEKQIVLLKEQLVATKVNADRTIKRLSGELTQRGEDIKNNPEYIENVAKRERVRRIGAI